MGDCGQYSAGMGIRFSTKRENEKNTPEKVQEFMSNRTLSVGSSGEATEEFIKECYANGTRIQLSYKDWESYDSNEDELEDMIGYLDDYYDKEFYSLETLREVTSEELEELDLDLIKKYNIEIVDDEFVTEHGIADVYESIYCENDNTSRDTVLAKKYADLLLIPNAQLVLTGDGDGNC